jgi:hypothetical protein
MVDGVEKSGQAVMMDVLQKIRSRSGVTLPNDRTTWDGETTSHYDYEIDYLESQMRGADFGRYLDRLDEEISLALFTPLLVLRTADVGSYNLGIGHMQVYLWMLNALMQDLRTYFEAYILNPLVDANFGVNASRPYLKFRRMGNDSAETIRAILTELIRKGKIKPDIVELGQMAGLELEEIQEITAPVEPVADPAVDPTSDPEDPQNDPRIGRNKPKTEDPRGVGKSRAVGKKIVARLTSQLDRAYRAGGLREAILSPGYEKQLIEAAESDGAADAGASVARVYEALEVFIAELVDMHEVFTTAESVSSLLGGFLQDQISAMLP